MFFDGGAAGFGAERGVGVVVAAEDACCGGEGEKFLGGGEEG